MSDHHPPHIFLDNTWYIITAATLDHTPFLAADRAKVLARDRLQELVLEFELTLRAWVILNDHYHLLFKGGHRKDLSRFFGQLHGSSIAGTVSPGGRFGTIIGTLASGLRWTCGNGSITFTRIRSSTVTLSG